MGAKILRHFEVESFQALPAPETYDGFVYGHVGVHEPEVKALIATGKRCCRYFNCLEMGRPDWHNAWFDYLRSTVIPLKAPNGKLAYFPWFSRWYLWDWSMLTSQRLRGVARKMVELAPDAWLYIDQFWLSPRWWMFAATGPAGEPAAQYADFPVTKWYRYEIMIREFAYYARSIAPVLLNGDRQALAPIYLEHPEWHDMEQEAVIYHQHPETVLSPYADIEWTVDWGIDQWRGSEKWLAFTGNDPAAVERAYARAHAARA